MNPRSKAKKLETTVEHAAKTLHAARLKRCGLTVREIGAELGCSHVYAARLVNEGLEDYRAETRGETAKWVEEGVAELLMTMQEAWTQWQRSKQDHQRLSVKTSGKGKDEEIEKTELIEPRCGDPRYLDTIGQCVERIAKLRGVLRPSTNITQQTVCLETPHETPEETARINQQVAAMFKSFLPPSIVDAHFGPALPVPGASTKNDGQKNGPGPGGSAER